MPENSIMYVNRCTKCAKLYIDETGRPVATLFKEHLKDNKYHRNKNFNQAGHSIHDVKGMWLLFTVSARNRKDIESYLVEILCSRKSG